MAHDDDPQEEAHAHLIALGLDEEEMSSFLLVESDTHGFRFSFDDEVVLPDLEAEEQLPIKSLALHHFKEQNHNVEYARGRLDGYSAAFVCCTSSYDHALDLCDNREGELWVAKEKNTPIPDGVIARMTELYDQHATAHFNDGLYDLEKVLIQISDPAQLRDQLARLSHVIRSIIV